MRGFGDSDEPTEITAYSTIKLREERQKDNDMCQWKSGPWFGTGTKCGGIKCEDKH
jgi:hypothetical protein